MSNWQIGALAKWHFDIIANWKKKKRKNEKIANSQNWQKGKLTKWQIDKMASWKYDLLPFSVTNRKFWSKQFFVCKDENFLSWDWEEEDAFMSKT